jgi:hypothetical protein
MSTREVTRIEDMSARGRMRVLQQTDGDIIVAVYSEENGVVQRGEAVEFCTTGAGGGRSPHTLMALRALMDAMEKDNSERPISAGGTPRTLEHRGAATANDVFGVCMLVAEAAWRAASGHGAVASDKLREVVNDVLEASAVGRAAGAAAVAATDAAQSKGAGEVASLTESELNTPLMRVHLEHLRHCAASDLESGKSAFFGFLETELTRIAAARKVARLDINSLAYKYANRISEGSISTTASLIAEAIGEFAQGMQTGDDEWISVTERLPDPLPGRSFSESVPIVNMNSAYPSVGMSELHFDEDGPTVWSGANPTHWQKPPALPKRVAVASAVPVEDTTISPSGPTE